MSKPLTRYFPYAERHKVGAWNAVMRKHGNGGYYAKDEADARFAGLEAERDELEACVRDFAIVASKQTQSALAAMAERDAARADAERYRFIRSQHSGPWLTEDGEFGTLDAAIDAARSKE